MLVSVAFAILVIIIDTKLYNETLSKIPAGDRAGGTLWVAALLFVIFPWVAMVSVISIIAAVKLLFKGKGGLIISLAAIILMAITLPWSIAGFVGNILDLDPDENLSAAIADWSGISLSIAMFPVWVLGWKRVQRK